MRRICAALVTLIIIVGILPVGASALEVESKSAFLMDVATGTVLFEQMPTNSWHLPVSPRS